MQGFKPAIVLDSGRVVKQGDLIRVETNNRGAIVGRFVNAIMDLMDSDRFSIRLVREDGGELDVVPSRNITNVSAYGGELWLSS